MKRYFFFKLVLSIFFSLSVSVIVHAESYYYSADGQLNYWDIQSNENYVYNVWGIMIIEESTTQADGFEILIANQQILDDVFPIKALVLIKDKDNPNQVFSGHGNIHIQIGRYAGLSPPDVSDFHFISDIGQVLSESEQDVIFMDLSGTPLSDEMFDTLPEIIDLRHGIYLTEDCQYCSIELRLRKIGTVNPLPTPDLDQDGDVDGNDLSIFSQSFGSIFGQ